MSSDNSLEIRVMLIYETDGPAHLRKPQQFTANVTIDEAIARAKQETWLRRELEVALRDAMDRLS